MAVRTPLVDDSTNLREATTAEMDQIKAEMIRQYSLNIPVTLTVVASGGNLGSLTDTRLQAGAHLTSTTDYPGTPDGESTVAGGPTPEPSQVDVTYDKISQTISSVSTPVDTNNKI
jgi:hypothetical protein